MSLLLQFSSIPMFVLPGLGLKPANFQLLVYLTNLCLSILVPGTQRGAPYYVWLNTTQPIQMINISSVDDLKQMCSGKAKTKMCTPLGP